MNRHEDVLLSLALDGQESESTESKRDDVRPADNLRRLRYTFHPMKFDHRRHFVSQKDVAIVLGRLPGEVLRRLRGVHFSDRSRGGRILGYVNHGHREICLCALPPSVSLRGVLGSSQATEFGALPGCQWPPLAVRRFMLYDVLLHELGHLQVIHEDANHHRRKFAMEPRAQEFADHWRKQLWATSFEHADPAHNPPAHGELEEAQSGWTASHAEYKRGIAKNRERNYELAFQHFSKAVEFYRFHSMALEELGILSVFGLGTIMSSAQGKVYFRRALAIDPALKYASLYMGP